MKIKNICNLKCKFCPDTSRGKQFVALENFEEIIRKIHAYTNILCLHVKVEPLLHNQLEDILKIIERYKLQVNITTNGTLIKENVKILKVTNDVRQIIFSLHNTL